MLALRDSEGCAALASSLVREGVAPDVALGWAARRADGRWDVSAGGATAAFFDLASLTKPMTALAVGRIAGAGGVSLRERKLGELLACTRGTPSEDATLELLLAHRAGLEANAPLFRPLLTGASIDLVEALREAASARRADATGPIPREGLPPVYSDLGYILVGEALASLVSAHDPGEVLGECIVRPIDETMRLGTARALEAMDKDDFDRRVVPTETVAWRGGTVRGRVHDENAFALRGAGGSGHAGMFGTVGAVLSFAVAAFEAIFRGSGPLAVDTDLDWLVRPRTGGTLRAGFDGKSLGGDSMAGAIAGPRTFGHLGFTGTSFWIDPDAEAVVALLTNRVHPTRDNTKIRAARPRVHDALFTMALGA